MEEKCDQVVAVVGTAGSGKTTIGMEVAKRFGVNCIDAGKIFRGLTLACQRLNLGIDDDKEIAKVVAGGRLNFSFQDYSAVAKFDGIEITDTELTSDWVNHRISGIAGLPLVRTEVRAIERSVADYGPLVMVGRDIGTVVFPNACAKFYVDVSLQVRAVRRATQRFGAGFSQDQYNATFLSLARRDYEDMLRTEGKLVHVRQDTMPIDNSGQLSITVDQVELFCRAKGFVGNK